MTAPDRADGPATPQGPRNRRVHRALVFAAAALAAAAAAFDTPGGAHSAYASRDGAPGTPVVDSTYVDAVTLARWIRARREGLVILDLQSDTGLAGLRVPTARAMNISALVDAELPPGATIVLFGEAATDVAAARAQLEARGFDARLLRGGADAWVTDVLAPVLPPGPTPASRSLAALSRYFGGSPRIGEPSAQPNVARSADSIALQFRRRGC